MPAQDRWIVMKKVGWSGGCKCIKNTVTLSGLSSGQEYTFRLSARNPATRHLFPKDHVKVTGTAG